MRVNRLFRIREHYQADVAPVQPSAPVAAWAESYTSDMPVLLPSQLITLYESDTAVVSGLIAGVIQGLATPGGLM